MVVALVESSRRPADPDDRTRSRIVGGGQACVKGRLREGRHTMAVPVKLLVQGQWDVSSTDASRDEGRRRLLECSGWRNVSEDSCLRQGGGGWSRWGCPQFGGATSELRQAWQVVRRPSAHSIQQGRFARHHPCSGDVFDVRQPRAAGRPGPRCILPTKLARITVGCKRYGLPSGRKMRHCTPSVHAVHAASPQRDS
ncbi:hypothetical protein L1887_57051 [Cichorium endivia]|nr:hypothetical protein L1887_57051 [Cichorium endivia]